MYVHILLAISSVIWLAWREIANNSQIVEQLISTMHHRHFSAFVKSFNKVYGNISTLKCPITTRPLLSYDYPKCCQRCPDPETCMILDFSAAWTSRRRNVNKTLKHDLVCQHFCLGHIRKIFICSGGCLKIIIYSMCIFINIHEYDVMYLAALLAVEL